MFFDDPEYFVRSDNVYVGLPPEQKKAYIHIRNGIIVEIIEDKPENQTLLDERLESFPVYDFHQYYITPGIIDSNVQLNPSFSLDSKWSDIENITQTALSGGVTTILNHPLYADSTQVQQIGASIEQLQRQCKTDFCQLALFSQNNIAHFEQAKLRGILGLKLYMAPPLQPDAEYFMRTEEICSMILELAKACNEKLSLYIHPIYIPLEKDLIYGSPCRMKSLQSRLKSLEQCYISHADAVKGIQEEDQMQSTDFQMGVAPEERQFMAQYYLEAKQQAKDYIDFLISRSEQMTYSNSFVTLSTDQMGNQRCGKLPDDLAPLANSTPFSSQLRAFI